MASVVRAIAFVAGSCLLAGSAAASASQPVRPGASKVTLAVAAAAQSATTAADEPVQPVSRGKSPRAAGAKLVVLGLGVGLVGVLVFALDRGNGHSVSPD
jgi:hypothetical protein